MATVVLAVLLAGMTITMTVPQARARFFEIIRRVHSTYDEIHYKNVRGETEVHTRPGWIPPGMKLHEEAVDEDFYLASWHSEDDEKALCLMASLIDDSAGALLNNEFSQTEPMLWNGDEVLVGKL